MNAHKSGIPLDLEEYSLTSFKNMDDLSSKSRAGVSNSATLPATTQTRLNYMKKQEYMFLGFVL